MSQANVSRIDRQQNLYLLALAEDVEALGGGCGCRDSRRPSASR
jgi:hypothetical protein